MKVLPAYKAASAVSIYISMPAAEVATWDLCRDALRAGKRLYVPRFSEQTGGAFSVDMDMLRVRNEHELHTLVPNRWGIGEPPSDADGKPREDALVRATGGAGLDLIVLPGVAFDRFGGRLGHGKGYYDRYVQRTRDFATQNGNQHPTLGAPVLTVAVALREQLLPVGMRVPTDDSDEPMHIIATAQETLTM